MSIATAAALAYEPFTYEDFLDLPARDGVRYEFLDGALFVNAQPTGRHQFSTIMLAARLVAVTPHHLAVVGPIDVRVPGGVLGPDIAVMPRELASEVWAPVDGARLVLAVEVESPSTRRRDRSLKAMTYAEAGIPAYWRLEFERDGTPTLVVHRLEGEAYVEEQRLVAGETGDVAHPFPVTLDPADLVTSRSLRSRP